MISLAGIITIHSRIVDISLDLFTEQLRAHSKSTKECWRFGRRNSLYRVESSLLPTSDPASSWLRLL
jgi:hypothetical protein